MFTAILAAILLVTLWLPSWIVLYFVRRLSARAVVRKSWTMWLVQLFLAVVLIFLADAAGLANPAGYTFGICVGLGVLGTAILSRLAERRIKIHRIIAGAIVCPALVPLTYFMATLCFSGYPFKAAGHLQKFLLAMTSLTLISYASCLLLGIPLIALLMKIKRLTCSAFIPSSAILGWAAVFVVCAFGWGTVPSPIAESATVSAFGAFAAVIVAIGFCLIAKIPLRNRDKALAISAGSRTR